MKRTILLLAAVLAAVHLGPFAPAARAGIAQTRHNLSVSGPGEVKAATEDQICIFCHTPHNARSDVSQLWNRRDSTANYTIYQSSTLKGPAPGQPTGASKLCLSCHDGTIALGAIQSRTQEIPFAGGVRLMPQGRAGLLGTNLSDDHPVSLAYDPAQAAAGGELKASTLFPAKVKLDKGGMLQCTSCHDPHDDVNGKFLVMSNRYSGLCTACHSPRGWATSLHAGSAAGWNGTAPDPWPDSNFPTVAENGCVSCHAPHTAGSGERLLKSAFEEDNCLSCHNGNVARTNIGREIAKVSGHKPQRYAGVHDPTENWVLGAVAEHAECADCHSAHQAGSGALGALAGVTGVNGPLAGGDTQNLCYKCHGGLNNAITTVAITRQILQSDVKKEFSPANPSFHPVGARGKNPDVPSLIAPWTVNSTMTCADCHGSNTAGAPPGPHGSDYAHLLKKNHVTRDNTTESAFNYELCYSCHSRTSILGNASFRQHRRHIQEERTPCSVCHDPHGVSAEQGNPVNNNHLINFDRTVVTPDSSGRLRFEDRGRFQGACYMRCHGDNHAPEDY